MCYHRRLKMEPAVIAVITAGSYYDPAVIDITGITADS